MLRTRLAATVTAVALFAAAGCGTDNAGTPAGGSGAVRLYGTDGNMSNSLGVSLEDRPGVLAGMTGTAPLAPLTEDFKARLRAVQPGLENFNYAGQSYDAVVVAALAAETGRSTASRDIARYLPGVTTGGTECTTVAECFDLIRKGKDIQYRGQSLRLGGFTDAGEPATATYGTLHFGRNNKIEDGMTEYVGAGNEADTTTAAQPAPAPLDQAPKGGPLRIGGLLPKTGQLASMHPPLVGGAKLGVKEVNDAGGVLDEDVVWIDGDDGTNPDVAKATVERLLAAEVQVIIGAGASGVSKAVIPRVTGAGVLMISPSATSDELSTIPDNDLFFRTAAPDLLQSKALADIVLRAGSRKVFVVARDDTWGQGLLKNLKANLESAGIPAGNIATFIYQPGASAEDKPDVATLAGLVKAFGPDGLVIIGFDESAYVIDALAAGDVTLHE